MELTLKDLIYMGVYVASVAVSYAGFIYRIQKTEEGHQTLKNIVFLEKGGLNIVTTEACKQHRNQIHRSIRREASITSEAFDQVHCLNQNVIKIMMHMKLEPIIIERRNSEGAQ